MDSGGDEAAGPHHDFDLAAFGAGAGAIVQGQVGERVGAVVAVGFDGVFGEGPAEPVITDAEPGEGAAGQEREQEEAGDGGGDGVETEPLPHSRVDGHAAEPEEDDHHRPGGAAEADEHANGEHGAPVTALDEPEQARALGRREAIEHEADLLAGRDAARRGSITWAASRGHGGSIWS